MDFEERIGILLITSFLALSLVSLSKAQWETTKIMNASISQPISVTLSGNLSAGIFFTNGTQIGIQYPITNVTIENNATANYWGSSYGTEYYLTASSGNTIDLIAYMSLCENLKNETLNSWINLTFDSGDSGGQGMFFKNGTTSTEPTLTVSADWSFSAIDTFKAITNTVAPGGIRYFRFWLDPWPNNAPSGIYNTTFKIRAVDYTQDPGSGIC